MFHFPGSYKLMFGGSLGKYAVVQQRCMPWKFKMRSGGMVLVGKTSSILSQRSEYIICLRLCMTIWCTISFQSKPNKSFEIFHQLSYHIMQICQCWRQMQRISNIEESLGLLKEKLLNEAHELREHLELVN